MDTCWTGHCGGGREQWYMNCWQSQNGHGYNQTWAYRTNIFLFVVTPNMFDRYHCDSGKDGPVPFSLCTSSSYSELANHQTYHWEPPINFDLQQTSRCTGFSLGLFYTPLSLKHPTVPFSSSLFHPLHWSLYPSLSKILTYLSHNKHPTLPLLSSNHPVHSLPLTQNNRVTQVEITARFSWPWSEKSKLNCVLFNTILTKTNCC